MSLQVNLNDLSKIPDVPGFCPICGEIINRCECTMEEFEKWAAEENNPKKVWTLTKLEHNALALKAWYNYATTNGFARMTDWSNLTQEEVIAWKNVVAVILFAVSERYNVDDVIIDYD